MKRDKSIYNYDNEINDVLDIVYAFRKSRVILTAFEVGIFDAIADKSKNVREIIEHTSTDQSATTKILNALVSMGLLIKSDNRYSNSKTAYALLVKGNPNYMSVLKYFNYVWKKWNDLTEVVKTGKSKNPTDINQRNAEEMNDVISAVHWKAAIQAPEIIKQINLRNVESVLDLGCGTGIFGMEMLKVNPDIELTLFDYPEVIEIAQTHIDRKNLKGMVNTLSGDILTDNIGKGYDLVFLSQVLHNYSMNDNLHIIRKVFDSLNIGGTIVIHESLINGTKDEPEYQAIQSIHFMLLTLGGEILTETDLWLLFKESLFSNFRKEDTDFGSSLIFGTK